VATATVTLYSWPIFAAILGRFLLGERIGGVRAALFAVAFMGIPLLYAGGFESVGQRDAIGITVMLISAALHALVVILLKLASAGSSRFESTFFQNLVGAIVFGILFFSRGVMPEPQQIAIGLALGLVVGLVAFTLFFVGMHQLSAGSAALLTYFEVVVATALGTLVLGEPLSWTTAVGGVLIVGSLVGAQWYVVRTGR
jgi:drug/metabolite transporter (DMT)-like permease